MRVSLHVAWTTDVYTTQKQQTLPKTTPSQDHNIKNEYELVML